MRQVSSLLTAGMIGLSLAACDSDKRNAETGVATAERLVSAVQGEVAKVIPSAAESLASGVQMAKQHLAARHYDSALAAARNVAVKAKDLAGSLTSKRTSLTADFTAMSGELPPSMERVQAKVARLAAAGALPPRVKSADFAALRTEVRGWNDAWRSAIDDFNKGEIGSAMAKAKVMKSQVTEAMALLGLSPPR